MKKSIHIKFLKREGKVNVYATYSGENDLADAELFFQTYAQEATYEKDTQIILRALENIGKRGVQTRYLRQEESFYALPSGTSNLRLYCIKVTQYCLILGGGGIKSSQKVQDSPSAFKHFKRMKKIDQAFIEAKKEGDIILSDDDELDGALSLEVED